jgi:hypothetical protein
MLRRPKRSKIEALAPKEEEEEKEMHFSYNLISHKLFFMHRAMQFHQQEISFRIQALWCSVMSKYVWYYIESSVCK